MSATNGCRTLLNLRGCGFLFATDHATMPVKRDFAAEDFPTPQFDPAPKSNTIQALPKRFNTTIRALAQTIRHHNSSPAKTIRRHIRALPKTPRRRHSTPVIPNGVSRRLFFAFTSCERVGSRREESLFDLSAERRFCSYHRNGQTSPPNCPQQPLMLKFKNMSDSPKPTPSSPHSIRARA